MHYKSNIRAMIKMIIEAVIFYSIKLDELSNLICFPHADYREPPIFSVVSLPNTFLDVIHPQSSWSPFSSFLFNFPFVSNLGKLF